MPLDFPNSPTTNQIWTATNGVQYQWDGTKWIMTGASGGSGYITDAPSDGNSYGRLNATWNPVLSLSGGGTVTGATNFTNVSYNMLASGAVGDGATDDTAKIQTWLNSLPVGVEVVLPANHQFLINSADLTIPAGTTIVGQGAMETGNNLAGPAFILNPNYRIIALGAVRLSNFKILRQGLLSSPTTAQANAAVAAWAAEAPLLKTNAVVNSGNTLPFANTTGVTVGMRASGGAVGPYNQTVTAVTPTSVTVSQITAPYPIQPGAYVRFGNSVALYLCVNCAGITLDRLFIMGFNTAIHSETGRSYIDSIEADCTMAMYITHAGDASYISKVHCIPYYGGDWSKRPGPNYLLTGSDGFYLESCTSVGWATGFVLAGVGGVTLNRCWTETTTDGVTVCTGFRTEGAIGNEVSLIGCVGSGSVAFDFQHYAGFAALVGCTSADGGGDATKIAHYRLGAMSSGQITSSEIIYTGITPFVVQPGVGVWRINTPQIYNQPNPWMSGAASDLRNITIFGGPALNGANNNLTIDTSGTLALQPNGGASTFGGPINGPLTIGHDQSSYWAFTGGSGWANASVNGIAQISTSNYFKVVDAAWNPLLQVATSGPTSENYWMMYTAPTGNSAIMRTPGAMLFQPGQGAGPAGWTIATNPTYSSSPWADVFAVQSTLTGNPTSGVNVCDLSFQDGIDASGMAQNQLVYLSVFGNVNAASAKGYRIAVAGTVQLNAALTAKANDYVGLQGSAATSVTAGGTGLLRGQTGGAFFGACLYASTSGSAQNVDGVIGMEVNPAIGTGTTARTLTGIQVVPTSAHQVRGNGNWDVGYSMTEQLGAAPIDIAYSVGDGSGQWPVRTDGAIFRGRISSGSVPSAARQGILLSEISFPPFSAAGSRGGAFVSNGFAVDGLGAIQCGTGYMTPISNGMSLNVTGSVGTGTPTVAAGGANYTNGDILYDGYGGVYQATVTSGAVTAVTVYTGTNGEVHQPWIPSHTPPTNPVPTKVWSYSGGASGCTLNLSWDTSRTVLAIQPSGGLTAFGGPVTTSYGPVIQWNSVSNINYASFGFWDSQTGSGFGMFAYTSSQLAFGQINQNGTGTQAQIFFDINAGTINPPGGLRLGHVNSDPAAVTGGIEMYPGYGGFGVTAGTLNYNWTGVHKFWAGGAEMLALASDGIYMVAPIGFNNATPIAKPTVTGAKGGNAALASLLTALANYGLVTDSTTA